MKSSDAALLTAIVVCAILIAAGIFHRRGRNKTGGFHPTPHNINIYDHPYKNYPRYEGRGATWWDGDHRCTSYCAQSPCTVWCQ
jgi:hypothetical protein